MSVPRRARGRWVVAGLVGLCVLGCLGTIWNYRGLHESTDSARLGSEASLIVATFRDSSRVAPGQRATVSFSADPSRKFTARVEEVLEAGETSLRLSSPPPADAGRPARVTVDTTGRP